MRVSAETLAPNAIPSVVPSPSVMDDPANQDFVDLKKIDFSIAADIRYATKNNFTKEVLYPEPKCALRKEVAGALSRAQSILKLQGVFLKVYDCYRPTSVQEKLWKLVPDPRYVSDPQKGSRHSRGAAVDVTLVDRVGLELEMPSRFDDFSSKAHRDSNKMTKAQRKNMKQLEDAMKKEGFIPFPTEWWHFDYKNWESYPLSDVPFAAIK